MIVLARLSRRGWCAAALPLLLAGAAQAQLLGPGDGQPLEVKADSGIEWQQDAHVYIARGNAMVKRGPSELHADTIVAHYRPAKPGAAGATPPGAAEGALAGNTEIYRVEADGRVSLKRDTQTVVGDRAVYDVDKAIMVMTGKGLKLTTATDTVTARDALEWYDQKQVAVARGDAVAIRNGKTIEADILTAYMVKTQPAAAPARPGQKTPGKPAATPVSAPPKPGAPTAPAQQSKIDRVDAQGHVVVTNSADTGRGDFGVYNAVSGICTLIGNVVISRAKDVIRGQTAVMDLNNNVSRILPTAAVPGAPRQRVQGLFVRDNAAAGAKPPAAKTQQ